MSKEYVSFGVSEEVNNILGIFYHKYFHKRTKKCWRYPVTESGGHFESLFIDDFYYDDDPLDDYDDTIYAFTWDELYALMNRAVKGDYRKSELELIDNIDTFALELRKELREKGTEF